MEAAEHHRNRDGACGPRPVGLPASPRIAPHRDVRHYGATMWSYRATPPMNRLFGREGARPGTSELYLFPGYVALLLAGVGLVRAHDRRRFAYLAGLLVAFEISRGLNGLAFPWLFEHVQAFRALRVPARIGILVNLSLAVLAGYGLQWLLSWITDVRVRAAATAVVTAALLVEYASAPVLAVAPEVSRIDKWLARQPPSVIVELPLASHRGGTSIDWLYMYEGIEHRQRMLNGYSGYAPGSYYVMLDQMIGFPDDRSIAALRERRVDYVVLRGEEYPPERWAPMIDAIRARPELSLVTILPFGDRFQAVFQIRD